jgi:hypothetical protein
VLPHAAVGDPACDSPAVSVVRGSGTGELVGPAGTLDVDRTAGGEHRYTFTSE